VRAACLLAALLLGCAPLASFRPPDALGPERQTEIGAGAVALSPRPYVDEPSALTGQLWATRKLASWLHVSAVGAFDDEALAAGLALQAVPVLTDLFAAGAEVELGYAWGAVALPMALRPSGWLSSYTAPRLGTLGDRLTPGIPGGVSVRVVDGFQLRAEVQVSWADFDAYQRRMHAGVAGVYAW
jgi:hypothetical protein